MIEFIYSFILYPLIHLSFLILSLFNEKIKAGLIVRRNQSWLQSFTLNTKWIWFHAASGEFEYAKPVINELKKFCPDHKILVTYFSPSALKMIQGFSQVDLAVPMPWDTPWHWQKFLNHYKPSVLAIARTDTWPNMIWQTAKASIPSILFSATLPSNSGRVASFFGRLLYGEIIEKLTRISCVSQADADNFHLLSQDSDIQIDGDTRFDQVFARLENPKSIKFINNLASNSRVNTDINTKAISAAQIDTNIFVAGSTWPADERVLFPALPELLKQNLCFIIAPHEPTEKHLLEIEQKLESLQIKSHTRYSQIQNSQFHSSAEPPTTIECVPGQVYIIDQVGILAELYMLSTISFVGGSFKKSIHSVMEPAAAGNFVVMGPYHRNSREALAFKNMNIAREFESSLELKKILESELKLSADEINSRRESILNFANSQKGASHVIAGWIKKNILLVNPRSQ
jgi:3-deoxy-D-manno-octulosonic-acid transferase